MEEEVEVSLHDYLFIILKRRWIVILTFLLVVATTLMVTLLMTPIYEAQTTLWIEKRPVSSSLLPMMIGFPVQEELGTQAEILKSRVIAEQVVKRLSLDKAQKRKNPLKRGDLGKEQRHFNQAVEDFRRKIRVEPIRNTDLIRIKVQDEDPAQAMEIANVLADVFVSLNLTFERGEAKSLYEFTKEQLVVTQQKLKENEEALKRYKEKSGISALGEETRGDIQKIINLEALHSETRTARQAAEVKLKDVRGRLSEFNEKLAVETTVSENRPIKELKTRLADLERRVSALARDYGEQDPRVRQVKKEIEETKEELNIMIANLVSKKTSTITPYLPDMAKPVYQELMGTLIRLETEINSSEAREKALARIIKEHEAKLEKLPAKELELARLMRAVEVNEKIYKLLLGKNEEARIAEAMQIGNIRIVDPAIRPDRPIKPKKRQNVMLGVIIGLMLGIGFAFGVEYLDPSVKTVDEAERISGLPIMGVIPTIKISER